MVQGVSPASRPRFGTRRPARSGARFPPPSIPGCRRPTCPPSSASSSTLRTPPSFSRCTADGVCCGFARATPTAPRAASTPCVASRAVADDGADESPWRTPATSPRPRPGRARAERGVRRRRASSRCRHRRRRATPRALLRVHRPRRRRRRARTHRGTHLRAVLPPRRRRARHAAWLFVGSNAPSDITPAAPQEPPRPPPPPPPSPPPRRPHLPSRARRSRRTHRPRRVFRHVAPPTQRS